MSDLQARIADLEADVEQWAESSAMHLQRATKAESRVRDLEAAGDKLADAAEPFRTYAAWKQAKGMRTKPPALGPKEIAALVDALAGWREARRGYSAAGGEPGILA